MNLHVPSFTVIGRGGEQITRLQAESGCKIQMAPDSGGQPDRLCTLTGSREAILRAKYVGVCVNINIPSNRYCTEIFVTVQKLHTSQLFTKIVCNDLLSSLKFLFVRCYL